MYFVKDKLLDLVICQYYYELIEQCVNLLYFLICYRKMSQESKSASNLNSEKVLQQTQSKFTSCASVLANSFFEVTVNSEKLSKLFTNIDEMIFQQNQKIQQTNRDLKNRFEALEQKLNSESKKTGLLFTKLDLRINQSGHTQYCYIVDINKKSEQRDHDLERKIQAAVSKIGRVQDTCKEDLKNGLIYLKKQIIGNCNFEQDAVVQPKTEIKIEPQLPKKIDFSCLMKHCQFEINKLRQTIFPTFQQLYQLKQLQKKKKHSQDMLDLTYRRDQQLQQTSFKLDQPFSRVIYPSASSKHKTLQKQPSGEFSQLNSNIRSSSKMKRHMSLTKGPVMQEQLISGLQQMVQKIDKIQQSQYQHGVTMAEFKNKQVVIDQKTTILSRKLEKNCMETAEIRTMLRKIQGHKMDQKSIQQLRHYIKWVARDLEQKINQKCTSDDLNKQKIKIHEKISILHENLIQKADKGEIQKALLFLQTKIKQIIFLIAVDHSQEKEGAIMKVAAKCLSCDKEIQRQLESQSKCRRQMMNKQPQGQYMKSMTQRIRQKYKKQMAQTLSNQTFD